MKPYEKFFESANIYDGYNDRKIIITDHAINRFFDSMRFPVKDKKVFMDKILWVGQNAIKEILNKYNDKESGYGIYSKSTGICLIINWRRQDDPKLDNGKNQAVIVTIPPIKKSPNDFHLKAKDIKILVEKHLLKWSYDDLKKDNSHKLMEDKKNCVYLHDGEPCHYGDAFWVVIDECKIYDTSIKHYFSVK